MKNPYEDMLHLPHHVSSTRSKMSITDRGAQFSPFAALTSHGVAILETARLTDRRRELSEDAKAALGNKLSMLAEIALHHPVVLITYFRADEKKAGGSYITAAGAVKKIDEYERILMFMDGTRIPIGDISEIESELFERMDIGRS